MFDLFGWPFGARYWSRRLFVGTAILDHMVIWELPWIRVGYGHVTVNSCPALRPPLLIFGITRVRADFRPANFRQTFFRTDFLVCIIFRPFIFSSRHFFAWTTFRLYIASSTLTFVHVFFRLSIFAFVMFFVGTYMQFFVHASPRRFFFRSLIYPLSHGRRKRGTRRCVPPVEKSAEDVPPEMRIFRNFSRHVSKFCIFQHFQNKVAEIREQTELLG